MTLGVKSSTLLFQYMIEMFLIKSKRYTESDLMTCHSLVPVVPVHDIEGNVPKAKIKRSYDLPHVERLMNCPSP